MRKLIALLALALVGLCLTDSQYANAFPRTNTVVAGNAVVQQRFGPLGRLREQTVINGGGTLVNGAVAVTNVRTGFRPLFRPVGLVNVQAPGVSVVAGRGFNSVVVGQNVVAQGPAFVNHQLLVDPRFRGSLNVLNTYNTVPTNTASNIVFSQPRTVFLQNPPVSQYLIQPPATLVQPAAAPAQYQTLPDPQPQSALPLSVAPLAVTQSAPLAVVSQPAPLAIVTQPAPAIAITTQPVYAIRGRFGLALRGC